MYTILFTKMRYNNFIFRPWSGSIKTLGSHKISVTCVLLLGVQDTILGSYASDSLSLRSPSNVQSYVIISGDKKGEVKIWVDGGSAITCLQSHLSAVRELRTFQCQVGFEVIVVYFENVIPKYNIYHLFTISLYCIRKFRMDSVPRFQGAWLAQYEYGT